MVVECFRREMTLVREINQQSPERRSEEKRRRREVNGDPGLRNPEFVIYLQPLPDTERSTFEYEKVFFGASFIPCDLYLCIISVHAVGRRELNYHQLCTYLHKSTTFLESESRDLVQSNGEPRFPTHVQQILAISNDQLDKLAEMADGIMAVAGPTSSIHVIDAEIQGLKIMLMEIL
ncbi:hypothetical protein NPIL_674811 [Nephila pilipes]|uniref:Uncharacterized protein n=1 Tax=Nephila pilipes TaxID=299642 RepID=A0A8X6IU78_NEPPI|nr:hypothetical protein NPIL_674811 [Nephila pilipes]